MDKQRLIPLIVATALFMENMDSTVIATSLAEIARDIGTEPVALKLAAVAMMWRFPLDAGRLAQLRAVIRSHAQRE